MSAAASQKIDKENLVVEIVRNYGEPSDRIVKLVSIAVDNFSGMKNLPLLWVLSKMASYPIAQYFASHYRGEVVAYILWVEHAGFRDEAFVELEQLAVAKDSQNQGIGPHLIKASFRQYEQYFETDGRMIKVIKVTTNVKNHAMEMYINVFSELGLELAQKVVIKDLYHGDEVDLYFKRRAV